MASGQDFILMHYSSPILDVLLFPSAGKAGTASLSGKMSTLSWSSILSPEQPALIQYSLLTTGCCLNFRTSWHKSKGAHLCKGFGLNCKQRMPGQPKLPASMKPCSKWRSLNQFGSSSLCHMLPPDMIVTGNSWLAGFCVTRKHDCQGVVPWKNTPGSFYAFWKICHFPIFQSLL